MDQSVDHFLVELIVRSTKYILLEEDCELTHMMMYTI